MKLGIYKKGQGKYTRLGTAFGLAILAAIGCFQLYRQLDAADWEMTARAAIWVSTMIPAALFVLLGLVIYWIVNTPRLADFMVAAEGEMKKVSWSSKHEIAVSTLVVIIVVFFLASLLGAADWAFALLFDALL